MYALLDFVDEGLYYGKKLFFMWSKKQISFFMASMFHGFLRSIFPSSILANYCLFFYYFYSLIFNLKSFDPFEFVLVNKMRVFLFSK